MSINTSSKTQQIYIRGTEEKVGDLGTITIAYRANKDRTEIGVAFCTPRDQFCRKTGRELAQARLSAVGDANYTYELSVNASNYIEVVSSAVAHLILDVDTPQWARGVLNKLLRNSVRAHSVDKFAW